MPLTSFCSLLRVFLQLPLRTISVLELIVHTPLSLHLLVPIPFCLQIILQPLRPRSIGFVDMCSSLLLSCRLCCPRFQHSPLRLRMLQESGFRHPSVAYRTYSFNSFFETASSSILFRAAPLPLRLIEVWQLAFLDAPLQLSLSMPLTSSSNTQGHKFATCLWRKGC